jgi:hypothetical protein
MVENDEKESCSYGACAAAPIPRHKGLCEGHFLFQYVTPLQKERRNLEDALNLVNKTIKEHLDEMRQAKNPQTSFAESELLARKDGYSNRGHCFCHKCDKVFDSGVEVIMHEENCKGRIAKRVAGLPRAAKQSLVYADDTSELVQNI